jgi:DNA-binding NtrC family response regulator
MNVLIIEDEHALAAALSTLIRRLGAEPAVAASGQSGIDKLAKRAFDLIVLDIGLPDMSGLDVLRRIRASSNVTPVLVITAHGTLDNALEARRLGASEYFLKPLDLAEFQQALRAFLAKSGAPTTSTPSSSHIQTSVMIGAAPGMQKAYAAIAQACGTDAPVLLTGASGTGKSLAARVIHANRSGSGPFLSFRVDEWPADQLQDRLFGHDTLPGILQGAAQGTLFIEDVATLPLPVQASLERALDATAADAARIIAATSRNLLAEVREGRFREDLYYRLKIVEVTLPSLAERTEDIPALASFFLSQAAGGSREISLSEQTLACLKTHPWPGNVRELRNAMQHAAAVCTGPVVLPRHLPETIARSSDSPAAAKSHLDDALQQALARWLDQKLTAPENALPAYDDLAEQVESMMLKELLPRFDNKPTRLATALQMNRATLRRKCRDIL